MRFLNLGTGFVGALLVFRYGQLFFRVISGPGDDNPIALLFLAAAALAVIPAFGLFLAVVRPPYGVGMKLWLAVSALVLALVTPFAALFFL